MLPVLPKLLSCGVSPFTAIRHMAARCIAVMAAANVHSVMKVCLPTCYFVYLFVLLLILTMANESL